MAKIWVSIKCLACGKVGEYYVVKYVMLLKQPLVCECGSGNLDLRSTKAIPGK